MDYNQSLPIGSFLLKGAYRIEKVLDKNQKSFTYLAKDETSGEKVVVREFFPLDYCFREEGDTKMQVALPANEKPLYVYKKKFLEEARKKGKLDHANLVKVRSSFEDNGTVYYVMDYIEGKSLTEMIAQRGPLNPSDVIHYIQQIGAALQYLHDQGVNHLNVKPSNIIVRPDGSAFLTGFVIPEEELDINGEVESPGEIDNFSPLELLNKNTKTLQFSPAIDIYSLAATTYYLLSGIIPPLPAKILVDGGLIFPPTIPPKVGAVIEKGMSPKPEGRYDAVYQFVADLQHPPRIVKPEEEESTQLVDSAAEKTILLKPEQRQQFGNGSGRQSTPASGNQVGRPQYPVQNPYPVYSGNRQGLPAWATSLIVFLVAFIVAIVVFFLVSWLGSNKRQQDRSEKIEQREREYRDSLDRARELDAARKDEQAKASQKAADREYAYYKGSLLSSSDIIAKGSNGYYDIRSLNSIANSLEKKGYYVSMGYNSVEGSIKMENPKNGNYYGCKVYFNGNDNGWVEFYNTSDAKSFYDKVSGHSYKNHRWRRNGTTIYYESVYEDPKDKVIDNFKEWYRKQ